MPSACPTGERAARTDAALRVLRGLIAGEPTVLDNAAELTLAPGVVPPPVWIGGGSAAARRRAAAHGDAWFPSMLAPARLAAGATHLAEMCVDQGRNDVPAIAIGGSALLGEPRSRAILDEHVAGLVDGYGIAPAMASTLPLTGPVSERLSADAQAGATHPVLGLIDEDWRTQCELLAQAKTLT